MTHVDGATLSGQWPGFSRLGQPEAGPGLSQAWAGAGTSVGATSRSRAPRESRHVTVRVQTGQAHLPASVSGSGLGLLPPAPVGDPVFCTPSLSLPHLLSHWGHILQQLLEKACLGNTTPKPCFSVTTSVLLATASALEMVTPPPPTPSCGYRDSRAIQDARPLSVAAFLRAGFWNHLFALHALRFLCSVIRSESVFGHQALRPCVMAIWPFSSFLYGKWLTSVRWRGPLHCSARPQGCLTPRLVASAGTRGSYLASPPPSGLWLRVLSAAVLPGVL